MALISERIDKVFGHLVIEVSIDEEKVRARFLSKQEPRFIESILRGRRFYEVPFVTSRICGACSIAHFLASIYALENAMNIEVHEDIKLLRDLMNQIQIAQNNVVHLLFLAIPDYLGVANLEELIKREPELVRDGMRLNRLCLQAVNLLAGRIVNPNTCNVGGFYREFEPAKIRKVIVLLKEAESLAKKFVDFVFQLQIPRLEEVSQTYAVLESPREYLVKGNDIILSTGRRIPAEEYQKVFMEVVAEGSTSKIVTVDNGSLYVGSRARVNAYYERLRELENYVKVLSPPSRNPFDNVRAKAIEILYTIKNVRDKLSELADRRLKLRVDFTVREGEGVGVLEAPRGLLIHHYRVDSDGRIVYANIITPTVFNARHIEECAEQLAVQELRSGSLDVEKLRRLTMMLVRAYDPCLPCATHVVVYRGG